MKNPTKDLPPQKRASGAVVPEWWRSVAFQDVIQTSEYGLSLPVTDAGTVPIIGMRHIVDGAVIHGDSACVELSGTDAEPFFLKDGDLLFNRTNSLDHVGKTGLVRRDSRTVFASYLIRLRVNPDVALPAFVCYFANLGDIRNLFRRLATPGASQFNINVSELKKYVYMPTPPLSEQRTICDILSTCDATIDLLSDLIAAKKVQKKALTQQLLTGRKRLPGFGDVRLRKKYRFFDLPSDWICPHLSDIAREKSVRNRVGKDVVVLSCSKHRGFVESSEYFGKQVFSADTSNYKVIRRNWFGYPANHVEEGSIGLLTTHDEGVVSPIYVVFETAESVEPAYLFALFKTEMYRHIFQAATNASVDRRGSLRWDAFAQLRVPCPSRDEQRAIVNVLHAADAEISLLEQKRTALQQQKKGLMQKLLTGQIRVKP